MSKVVQRCRSTTRADGLQKVSSLNEGKVLLWIFSIHQHISKRLALIKMSYSLMAPFI